MKTDLFYYTGTGNSLWVARELAKGLGDARICPMNRIPGEIIESGADAVGIIFPVHIWGLPHRVIAFVDALAKDPSRYYFAVAVNAGQVAATLLQLKRLMRAKGISLSAGFEIAMPSNYIPWGGPGPEEKRRERFDKARKKIERDRRRGCQAGETAGRERSALAEHPVHLALPALLFPGARHGQELLGRCEMQHLRHLYVDLPLGEHRPEGG